MNCKKCGSPLRDEDKFCPNCGQSVEISDKETTAATEEIKKWYYVKDSQSKGPYTEEEMVSLLDKHEIDSDTYVWGEGMDAWTHLKETELNKSTAEKKKEESASAEEKIWYYIDDAKIQNGPFTTSEMLTFLSDQRINYLTYVWKTGMEDWKQLRETDLDSSFKGSGPGTIRGGTDEQSSHTMYSRGMSMVEERNIASAIIFSIITCGIYELYWLYCLANDANRLSESQGFPSKTSGGIVVLLSIVTCGIYGIYFVYAVSKQLSELYLSNGKQVEDNSIVNLLLSIFGLGIVAFGIIQNTINECVRYGG